MGVVERFELQPRRVIGGRYVVNRLLGWGYEGEVYAVTERNTGIQRALKIFYPQRNQRDQALTFYARKLDRLRHCPILIQYHHTGTFRIRGGVCSYLVSELVEGELLADLIKRSPGRRLQTYEALLLLHTLAGGLELIHRAREYHGDVHDMNILVKRRGVHFDVKLVDFYQLGRADRGKIREDVIQLIRVLYDMVGGQRNYARQPAPVKYICAGLRRTLIAERFPTAAALREHLDTFTWP